MAEGIDNLDEFGEQLEAIGFSHEASDQIRSMAVLEDCSPHEVVRRGLAVYDGHLKLLREGYVGPFYNREVTNPAKRLLGRIGLSTATETIQLKFNFEE